MKSKEYVHCASDQEIDKTPTYRIYRNWRTGKLFVDTKFGHKIPAWCSLPEIGPDAVGRFESSEGYFQDWTEYVKLQQHIQVRVEEEEKFGR